MKFLLIIFVLITSYAFGQTPTDSIQTKQIIDIKAGLLKSHQRYSTGTAFVVMGAIGTIAATAFKADDKVIIAGGIVSLIGALIQMDSHKFIGRAGRWDVNGNGVTYSIR